jgi:N-acetylglucosaminyldiphosphoundecaprenol N-acetyl-beta-D-mannosaminyltransferase
MLTDHLKHHSHESNKANLPDTMTPATIDRSYRRARIYFLDVPLDAFEIHDVLDWVENIKEPARFKYVVTPNVHHVVRALKAPDSILPLYERASLSLCDSKVLSFLLWTIGLRVPTVTGADLTPYVLTRAETSGHKLMLIGIDDYGARIIGKRYPNLRFSFFNPPMGFIHDSRMVDEICRRVEQADCEMILIAVGSPQQEILASVLHQRETKKGTAFCVGAALNYLTGRERRAPKLLRTAGLEWFYRLLHDPRRLGSRYILECPQLIYYISRCLLSGSSLVSRTCNRANTRIG